jgi:outer membrane receptor for Fe3+-dicitrate
VSPNNRFDFQNSWAEKYKNARDASDTRPIETTYVQSGVPREFGTWGWSSGVPPVYKASDRHVFSDRFVMEVMYAHVGNNFQLGFQSPALRDVQPSFEITTACGAAPSRSRSSCARPTASTSSGATSCRALGGDHSFKMGYRWRTARAESINHRGGNIVARFNGGVPAQADVYRDGYTNYRLNTHGLYIQDTMTVNRLTLNLGLRFDSQTDKALPSTVPANPIIPEIMPGSTSRAPTRA